jgi:Mrp family chromosome partitioning ATPase/capsular polysaccharide biosynthesis protein
MESINFAGALWRSWRLLLALALVGALISLVLPISPVTQPKPVVHWKATAVVGAAPKGGDDLVGGGVTGAQVVFYGNSLNVQAITAKAAHQVIPTDELSHYMSAALGTPSTKSTSTKSTNAPAKGKATPDVVTLTAYGKKRKEAVELVNTYANSLGSSIAIEAVAHEQAVTQSKAATKTTTKPTSPSSGSSGTTPNSSGSTPGSSGSPGTSPSITSINTGYAILYYASQATRIPPVSGGLLDTHKGRVVVGFFLGLLLGAVIAVARVILDKRIRTAGQAAHSFGFPVIVEILARPPVSADERAPPVDVAMQPGSVEAEAFRMLRMSVLFEGLADTATATDPLALAFGGNGHGAFGASVPVVPEVGGRVPGERHIVLVASPGGEETRPMVAANLAAVYAEAGQRVIVATTADLGVGQPVIMGNSEALLSGDIHPVDVEARLQPTWVDDVVRLPFTMFLRNSGQLVSRGKELLDAARSVSDVIIVETPGLLSVHHAEALSHAVDVMVVVGESSTTRIADARKASDLLRRIGAPVLGVVLTNVRPQGRAKASQVTPAIGPVAVPSGPLAPANGAVSPRSDWEEPTAKTQI